MRNRLHTLVCSLLLVGVLFGCSDGSDGGDGPNVFEAPEGFESEDFADGTGLGIAMTGSDTCTDPEGDVGSSTSANVAPFEAQPNVDLISSELTLSEGIFEMDVSTAGDIRTDVEQQFLFQVGLLDDPAGFDLRVAFREGVWTLAYAERGLGIASFNTDPSATVTVDGNHLFVSTVASALPSFIPGQTVVPGVSAIMASPDGTFIDREGNAVEKENAIRAFDDCL